MNLNLPDYTTYNTIDGITHEIDFAMANMWNCNLDAEISIYLAGQIDVPAALQAQETIAWSQLRDFVTMPDTSHLLHSDTLW